MVANSQPVATQTSEEHEHRGALVPQHPGAACTSYERRAARRTRARTPCRTGRGCFSCSGPQPRLHSIGVSVSDTKPEISTAAMIVTANSCSSRPSMPPMNSTGMNTAASDSVIDRMVKPISFEPSSVACSGALAHLHVARDVLQHHDRVVHDEADAQRQRHQRQVVEAVAEQVHHGERADDRHRQRQARDQRGREVAQEEEDHHAPPARARAAA